MKHLIRKFLQKITKIFTVYIITECYCELTYTYIRGIFFSYKKAQKRLKQLANDDKRYYNVSVNKNIVFVCDPDSYGENWTYQIKEINLITLKSEL